jgi:hypothetical protein
VVVVAVIQVQVVKVDHPVVRDLLALAVAVAAAVAVAV